MATLAGVNGDQRLVTRVRAGAVVAAVIVCELAVGALVVDPRFSRLLLLAGAALVAALIVVTPFAATCALLVLTASVVQPGSYAVGFGPTELRVEELLLGVLLMVALLRPRRAWWGGLAGGALAAFLGAIAFSALVALQTGAVTFADALGIARPLALLTVFYVVVRLYPTRSDLERLLTAAVIVVAVGGLISLVLALPGNPLTNLVPGYDPTVQEGAGLGAIDRVRLPAVLLGFPLLWYATVRWINAGSGSRLRWALAVGGIAAAIAVSFNRNMWVGVIVGLGLMLAFGAHSRRRRFVAALLAVAAAGIALSLSPARVTEASPLSPVVERGRTLFQPQETAKEGSLDERREESRIALEAIERHPVLGVGPGASFGRRGLEPTAPGLPPRRSEQLWVHNQYLHILLMGGVVALLPFLAFLGLLFREVMRYGRTDDALLSLGIGLAVAMLSALVMIYVVNATAALTLGLLGGAIMVLASRRPAPSTKY